MKSLILLLSTIAVLASCSKPATKKAFHKQIQGTWIMKEARLSHMDHWENFPTTEDPVTITENFISNPWNKEYEVLDNGVISFGTETINVTIHKKDEMLWVSNNDSLKFERQ